MRLHRFIGDFDLTQEKISLNDSEIINQLAKVFRLKIGDFFLLCDGKGNEAKAEIISLSKTEIIAVLSEKRKIEGSRNRAFLFCAVLKKDNFELVVQKATEVGISAIIPIRTERTIKTDLNIERLKKIAREASEQSGRGDVPEIMEIEDFEPGKYKKEENYLFDLSGEKYACEVQDISPRSIWIGPEGGFSEEEIKKARDAGFRIAGLGPLTLRAETAAIVASYLAAN